MALDLDARPGVRDQPGLRFTPGAGEAQLPPSGAPGRARANLDAIRLLQLLAEQERDATDTERGQLARWSGWGAVAELFDEQRQEWQHDREELRALVGEHGLAQARRTSSHAGWPCGRFCFWCRAATMSTPTPLSNAAALGQMGPPDPRRRRGPNG